MQVFDECGDALVEQRDNLARVAKILPVPVKVSKAAGDASGTSFDQTPSLQEPGHGGLVTLVV